ncbi:ABC transporter permease [Candidatus Pacearchaeota archaeon]|nr:ABC transporter permease [Candidatus Pacearchaeota archaeon]
MRNLISTVLKDIKLFGRSRVSALITVVVPLFIALFAGLLFSTTSLQGINVAVYSSSYSELSDSILASLSEQSYIINKLASVEHCVSSVKQGDSQICVILPPDLSREGNAEPVIFHVDNSRINLAHLLVNEVRSKVSSKAQELELSLVEALTTALQEAKARLPEQKSSLSSVSSSLSNIESKANSAASSMPNVGDALSSIKKAKNLAGQLDETDPNTAGLKADLEDELNGTLQEINDLNSSISGFSEDFGDIKVDTAKTRASVYDISSKIDKLITELNNVRVTDAEKIVSPIKTEIQPVNTEFTNSNFIFPVMITLLIFFGSTTLAAVLVLKERKTMAYFRNFITPTSDFTFIIAMYIAALIIIATQLLVLFVGLYIIAKVPFIDVLGEVVLILFISVTAFIFLGMLIGYVFRSDETTILVSVGVVLLLVLLSNTILPIEFISAKFQNFVIYNPFVVASSMLKKLILFKANLYSIWPEMSILGGTSIIFLLFVFISRKLTKRHL